MEVSSLANKYINFPINFFDVLSAIIIACLLSLLVKLVYSFRHTDHASDWRLQDQFYLLGPIVSVIMLFIGSNLALSIGLVGSLSIIRFRSAIKSPMDLIYLLWVIAIGLGAGTLNFIHIISATGILTFIVLLKKLLFSTEKAQSFNVLNVQGDLNSFDHLNKFMTENVQSSHLLSHHLFENTFESSFRVNQLNEVGDKVKAIKALSGITSVNLINNDNIFAK